MHPSGPVNIYVKRSSGAGSEELLLESPQDTLATDCSPDGRFLLYMMAEPKNQQSADVWVLPLGGDRKPFVFLNCHILLRVPRDTGVIEQRRSGVFRGSPELNLGAVPTL